MHKDISFITDGLKTPEDAHHVIGLLAAQYEAEPIHDRRERRIAALAAASRKFDLLPKHGKSRRYTFAPIGRRGKRIKVKSRDGTRESERQLAARLNWLRERIG